MKHAVSRELYGYWDHLRADRSAPERSDIDPAMIRTILSDTFIVESDHAAVPPLFPFRLTGARLNSLPMEELKGRSLLSCFDAKDRPSMLRILHCVLDHRTPALVGLKAGPLGYPPIDLEMLLLPLRHHGKTHARMLGAIAPFETPSWLGLLPVNSFGLASLRFVEEPVPADDLPSHRTLVFRKGVKTRQYGYLVVHEGGRTPRPA